MSENAQSHESEQTEEMERYSITFDGEKYQLGQYRYDKLEDAISYARSQDKKSNPTRSTKSEPQAKSSSHLPAANYQSQYGAARTVSMFISFLGWAVFSGGIIAALVGIGSGSRYGGGVSLLALLPGLGMAVAGLFLVAAGQVTRATVDSADQTREILNFIRNHT